VKQRTIEEVLEVYFPDTEEQYRSDSYLWSVRGSYMNVWFGENEVYDENGNRIIPWR